MAHITTARPVGAGFSVTTLFAGLVGRISAWNEARITRNSLMALSDRELDDLGLSRADIESVAQGTYRQSF